MNEIMLKKELFRFSNIQQSIVAFSDLCIITVYEQDNAYLCTFTGCKYDTEETVREFENYLIDLSYKNR